MVIDEGIDLSAADFSGKVIAAYTVTCDVSGSGGDPNPADGGGPLGIDGIAAGSFADQKQAIITELALADDSCHLVEGISKKPDPLASIARYRNRWNAAMRNNQVLGDVFTMAEAQDIMPALDAELTSYRYHGTSTAGTAAHENPDVRLVLVERSLGDASDIQQTYTCVAQADLDRFTALYTDAEVLTAYANQPRASLDADYARVVSASSVGLMNESFGSPARLFLDQLQAQAQCPTADLTGYFSALGGLELTLARVAAAVGPQPLRVQSSGNEGAQIDSVADDIDCDLGDSFSMMVGSTDLQGVVSSFSNHGQCVSVYAPGEAVVTPYAGGWLFAVDGTSFSAPLTARTLSLMASVPYDAAQAKQALVNQVGASSSTLLPSSFPRDFFYAPGMTSLALTAASAQPAGLFRPHRLDLRGALGPLARRHHPR
jgi:hypothetical protein